MSCSPPLDQIIRNHLLGKCLRKDGKSWGHGSIVRFQVWELDGPARGIQRGTFEIWYADWIMKDRSERLLLTSNESDYQKYEEGFANILGSKIGIGGMSEMGISLEFQQGYLLSIARNKHAYSNLDDVYSVNIFGLGYFSLATNGSLRREE